MAYKCETCGERVPGLKSARKHATQGYRTQREAFAAGALHTLALATGDEGSASPLLLAGFVPVVLVVIFLAHLAGAVSAVVTS